MRRAGHADRRRPEESGFALLLVFLMAALIAIALYKAMPVAAFESQRHQEELLIDRGEQYRRAIKLYFRAFHKYPAKIEDLENTNNQRFLRHRFVDPITGKAEWRAIHIGPGGAFTDSRISRNKQQQPKTEASVNTFTAEGPAFGGAQQVTDRHSRRRRPSDGGQSPDDPSAGLPPLPDIAASPSGTVQPPAGSPAPMNADGSPNAAAQNAAVGMLQKLLTTPHPFPNQGGAGPGGQQVGGGIAGFASLSEEDSIKVYNEQDEYDKWEFVYDFAKDKGGTGGGNQTAAIPNQNGNANGPTDPGAFNNNGQNGQFLGQPGRPGGPPLPRNPAGSGGFGQGFGSSFGGGGNTAGGVPGQPLPGQLPGQPPQRPVLPPIPTPPPQPVTPPPQPTPTPVEPPTVIEPEPEPEPPPEMPTDPPQEPQ